MGLLDALTKFAESTRDKALDRLDAIYRGRQYEGRGLGTPWTKVRPGTRKTPMRFQKPSVQYDLAKLIVDRPTSLLFGEGRFPEVTFEPTDSKADPSEVNAWFAQIIDEGSLAERALTWSRQGGAIGTACITWCVVDGEFEFESHRANCCTPTFHKRKRSRLIELEKRYKFDKEVKRYDERTGATVTTTVPYWHREVWNETQHIIYNDVPVGSGREPTWTVLDTVTHNFGFVPAAWVKNVDDGEPESWDGVSLIDGLEDIFEDIDRTLSQKSRAVSYNQEPERVYYGLREDEKNRVEERGGGSSKALPPKSEGGGVDLLELQGEGQRVAEEHIVSQRSRALDVSRVTAPEPERLLAAAKSGVALRMLFAPTLELVGELRQTYGRALREIFTQILRAAREGKLALLGLLVSPHPTVIPAGKVKLLWGRFFDPTPEDIDLVVRSAVSLFASKLIDRETLIRWLSSYLGIKDIAAVMQRIEDEANSEYGPMGNEPKEPDADDEKDDTGNDPAESQPTGETVAQV